MGNDFYLDYEGAGSASSRFARRSRDLSGAAGQLTGASTCGVERISALVDDILEASTGRMYGYSDELSVLARLVDDTIEVYNQLDVTYSTGA